MAKRKRSAVKANRLHVVPGDYVLCGNPRGALPSEWFIGRILWTDGVDVVTRHEPASGGYTHTQVLNIEDIRCAGDIAELIEFRKQAYAETAGLEEKVRDAERELVRARDAIWIRIDQMTDRRLATRATAQEAKREEMAEAAAIGGYEPGERR